MDDHLIVYYRASLADVLILRRLLRRRGCRLRRIPVPKGQIRHFPSTYLSCLGRQAR